MSIAYLFPGQGSQKVGMGRELVESKAEARALFDEADALLGFSLSTLCFDGPEDALTDTVNQQPALFTTSLAMYTLLKAAGKPAPAFVAGHSMGELSALAAAGVMSFADGLKLARQRGELMAQAGEREPGAMAAILALDTTIVRNICQEASQKNGRSVQLANDNCPGQIVISGNKEALNDAVEMAKDAGARKVVVLPITIAAHSQLMASAALEFAEAVAATPMQAPQIPIIGNVSAQPLNSVAEIQAELEAQLTAPVRWTESMTYLVEQGVEAVLEVGPGDVLLKLMRRIHRKTRRLSFELS
ncbi:MAG: [acyl-carrier-protein] S-malonyltransferase [Chloroflexi bacterium]|nr:MAG: [acyl-carrier-protein] S-malonyltransferase [Chloroflexota bacterium]